MNFLDALRDFLALLLKLIVAYILLPDIPVQLAGLYFGRHFVRHHPDLILEDVGVHLVLENLVNAIEPKVISGHFLRVLLVKQAQGAGGLQHALLEDA